MKERMLVLQNGRTFIGQGFGANTKAIAEIVFNTSMVGYQEIASDPSYYGQMVVMSYPLIGNYGITDDDYESRSLFLSGFIVREYNDFPSNFRYTKTLSEAMVENNVPGICGIDTRELIKIIRDEGTQRAMITDADRDVESIVKELNKAEPLKQQVKSVSLNKVWYKRTRNPLYTVVAVDCGIKISFIRELNRYGCNVVVVPFNTSKEQILALKPDGIFISNGPGNPIDVPEVIELVKTLRGEIPIMGIALGHLIIGLAYGAKTYKMKIGHRGANQSVKNLSTDKIEITAQNHSYALLAESIQTTDLKPTHINLVDGEIEGMIDEGRNVISVQFYPESEGDSDDSEYIFSIFTEMMKKKGGTSNAKENRY